MYTLNANQSSRLFTLLASADDELARQRAIVRARRYDDGQQFVRLTDRLRRILGDSRYASDAELLRLNICRIVVTAVLERLNLLAITHPSDDMATWYQALYERSGGARFLNDLLRRALVDGEAFIIVDVIDGLPQLFAHPRYVDAEFEHHGTLLRDEDTPIDTLGSTGIGYGCIAHYLNDDPSMPLDYIVKRWREVKDGKARQRMTKYYADRIEKYELSGAGWQPITDDGEPWPLPLTLNGEPLGCLAIHVTNADWQCEAWEAIPLQNAINKMLVDAMQESDFSASRLLFLTGMLGTTDGLPLAEDGSNALQLNPGQIIATTNPDARMTALPGGSLEQHFNTLDDLISYAAMVTDTPSARFQRSGQIARAETIKAQEAPLVAKIVTRQNLFGQALALAMLHAARFAALNGERLDTDTTPFVEWTPAETQDEKERLENAKLKREALGLPLQQIWREYGYSELEIERMLAEKAAAAPMIPMTATPTGQTAERDEENERDTTNDRTDGSDNNSADD